MSLNKVLIVDDSPSVCQALSHIIGKIDNTVVIGIAHDAYEAKRMVIALDPDIITLDVDMPNVDGLTFLDRLMKAKPTPVVLISSKVSEDNEFTQKALQLGALSIINKTELNLTHFDVAKETLKNALNVALGKKASQKLGQETAIIAIGASTGGTKAVHEILRVLPATMPPIVVTVHMPEGFTASFANRLNDETQLKVAEAKGNEILSRGNVYIAPGNQHLTIMNAQDVLSTKLSHSEKVSGHRPSVDALFTSIANASVPAIGVLLSGMGKDGAKGMLKMKDQGAYTIAQNEQSCLVYGMPRAAVLMDAHCIELSLTAIADRLITESKSVMKG